MPVIVKHCAAVHEELLPAPKQQCGNTDERRCSAGQRQPGCAACQLSSAATGASEGCCACRNGSLTLQCKKATHRRGSHFEGPPVWTELLNKVQQGAALYSPSQRRAARLHAGSSAQTPHDASGAGARGAGAAAPIHHEPLGRWHRNGHGKHASVIDGFGSAAEPCWVLYSSISRARRAAPQRPHEACLSH